MRESKFEVATVIGAVVVLMTIGVLLFSGSQTSTILSKVGAAVGTGPNSEGSSSQDQPAPEGGAEAGSGVSTDQAATANAAPLPPPTLLIIHKGTLTLEVASVGPATASAANLVTSSGGFVAGSKEAGTGADAAATADYRIPADAWERTLAGLRDLATVRAQEISTDEVTGQVVDLGARIANLRATESALQAIMARASKIEDVLAVQKQLTDTRGQIEELVAQKASLEDRAAFGSLSVTFVLPPRPAPASTRPPGWDPGRDIDAASAKLVRIGQKATTAGIWFAIVGLPIIAALGIAVAIAWLAYRGYRMATRRRAAGDSAAA
ncbi:MAG TPA: DUF4349 domain-containing protein [Candidatus Limnocylindrales bacterium]|jgi:hypothetical protein